MSATSCAAALKRDGHCLEILTQDYLDARETLNKLESDWREAVEARDRRLATGALSERLALDRGFPADAAPRRGSVPPSSSVEVDPAAQAFERWQSARQRLQPTIEWYGRVYQRVSARIEEDQILTEAGLVLLSTPAIVFYPIVRWNVRSALWDGADPDAATDPVTRYCSDRLSRETGRPSN